MYSRARPARRTVDLYMASSLDLPMNVRIRVARTPVKPALPSSISILMILLLTGWFTTYSDSLVVNPAPEKADCA